MFAVFCLCILFQFLDPQLDARQVSENCTLSTYPYPGLYRNLFQTDKAVIRIAFFLGLLEPRFGICCWRLIRFLFYYRWILRSVIPTIPSAFLPAIVSLLVILTWFFIILALTLWWKVSLLRRHHSVIYKLLIPIKFFIFCAILLLVLWPSLVSLTSWLMLLFICTVIAPSIVSLGVTLLAICCRTFSLWPVFHIFIVVTVTPISTIVMMFLRS